MDRPRALFEYGLDTALTARALIQANGVNEQAAHLLLTGHLADRVAPLQIDTLLEQTVGALQLEPTVAHYAAVPEPTYCRYYDVVLGRRTPQNTF